MKPSVLLCLLMCVAGAALSQNSITLQPGPAGKDAEVFSCVKCGYADRNFGNIGDLCAVSWTNNGYSSKIRGLIQFDLSGIPAGANITDARLSLYYNPNTDEGTHFKYFGNNSALLQRITQNWNEFTVTWNNQPATTTQNQVVLPSSTSSTQDYPNINVTNLVKDMVNNPSSSFGFMLRLQYESHFRKLIFASGDYSVASKRPKLVITYTTSQRLMEEPVVFETRALGSSGKLSVISDPAHSAIDVSFTAPESGNADFKIFNVTGQTIRQGSFENTTGFNRHRIPVPGLAKGFYFILISGKGITDSQRFIID